MADLARTNFTINESWYEDVGGGKRKMKCLDVTITTGTAGTASNKINASIFGLAEIYEVFHFAFGAAPLLGWRFVPSADGTVLYAQNFEQGTDADRGDPADIAFATNNARLIIKGRPNSTY